MLYFLLIIISAFLLHKYSSNREKPGSNRYYIITCLLWIIVVGIRYRVGIDTLQYETKFENTEGMNVIQIMFTARYEFMWSFFMYVLHSLNLQYIYLQFIHAIIFNVLLFVFVKKISLTPSVSLILFSVFLFFYFETEILRESLAVIISLTALYLLYKGNKTLRAYVVYYSLIVLAILFHSSALIMLVYPLILKIFESKFLVPKLFFILLLLLLFATPIVDNFIDTFVSGAVVDKVDAYQDREISGSLLYLRIIEALIALVVAWVYSRTKNAGEYRRLIRAGVWFYAVLMIGACVKYGIFGRLVNYFSILYYVSIAELIVSKVKNARVVGRLCCLALLVLFLYQMSRPATLVSGIRYYNKYLPYTTVFDDTGFEDRVNFQNLQ